MSNKKRISKRIIKNDAKRLKAQNLDAKLMNSIIDKIQDGYKTIESSINDFLYWAKFYFPSQIFDNHDGKISTYEARPYQEYVQGYSFEENFDSDFIDFVFEIRKLTPLDEFSCKNLCRKVPSNLRNDFINLVIVGFEAYEAFHLLQETYKF